MRLLNGRYFRLYLQVWVGSAKISKQSSNTVRLKLDFVSEQLCRRTISMKLSYPKDTVIMEQRVKIDTISILQLIVLYT